MCVIKYIKGNKILSTVPINILTVFGIFWNILLKITFCFCCCLLQIPSKVTKLISKVLRDNIIFSPSCSLLIKFQNWSSVNSNISIKLKIFLLIYRETFFLSIWILLSVSSQSALLAYNNLIAYYIVIGKQRLGEKKK